MKFVKFSIYETVNQFTLVLNMRRLAGPKLLPGMSKEIYRIELRVEEILEALEKGGDASGI